MQRKTIALGAIAGGAALLGYLQRRQSRFGLSGKNVLVTGGSRGLGLVLARELLSCGARVAVCGRDPEELERAERDLSGRATSSDQVVTVPCDVTRREEVDDLVREVERRLGPIDVLINNAGVIQVGPMENMDVEDYEAAMRVHFFGPLYATLAVLPRMKERRSGRIANISSIGGKIAVPHLLPYTASKFALTGFSEGLRQELSRYGIWVTTICPGLMRTGSPPNAVMKGQHEREYAWFSTSAALPGLTIAAERAARRILRAIERGEGEVVLGLPAKVAVATHAVAGSLTTDVLGFLDRAVLPEPDPDPARGGRHRKGGELPWTGPAQLERFVTEPARRNNEIS